MDKVGYPDQGVLFGTGFSFGSRSGSGQLLLRCPVYKYPDINRVRNTAYNQHAPKVKNAAEAAENKTKVVVQSFFPPSKMDC